jgi:hypothetical protein
MLMIAQTLQNEVSSRPLVLNGPLVRLGMFEDIKSNSRMGKSEERISVGWSLTQCKDINANEQKINPLLEIGNMLLFGIPRLIIVEIVNRYRIKDDGSKQYAWNGLRSYWSITHPRFV